MDSNQINKLIQVKLLEEFCSIKNCNKFLKDINKNLKDQISFLSYENVSKLLKNINNKEKNDFSLNYKKEEQLILLVSLCFCYNSIFQSILNLERELNNYSINASNKLKIKKRESMESYFFMKANYSIFEKQKKDYINSIKNIKMLSENYVKEKISTLNNNYYLNIKDLSEIQDCFSYYFKSKSFISNIEKVSLMNFNSEDLFENSKNHMIFIIKNQFVDINKVINLLKTPKIYLDLSYLKDNMLSFYFVYFYEIFKHDVNYVENYNVFSKIFYNNFPIYNNARIEDRILDWQKNLQSFSSLDDCNIKECLKLFLIKEFIIEFNKLSVINFNISNNIFKNDILSYLK